MTVVSIFEENSSEVAEENLQDFYKKGVRGYAPMQLNFQDFPQGKIGENSACEGTQAVLAITARTNTAKS
jgi:hypothetical protein